MSIANELSSDVAAALLARGEEDGSTDSHQLKKVVMSVHSTLRRLTKEARKSGRSKPDSGQSSAGRVAQTGQ